MSDALVPTTEGGALRDALIRAVGFDRLSEPQRELALAIAQRYELDPMLKHLVMIEGRPYITRDGLLHVAHRSGVFDGIEVSDPQLDETADGAGRRYWRARCTVHRKDFSRPFVYPGRYPVSGKNAAYAEEMAVKVAEVMCLRRAFDVSAPTVEERWDEEYSEGQEQAQQPASLAERALLRAAEIERQRSDAGEPSDVGEGETYAGSVGAAVDAVIEAASELDQEPTVDTPADDPSGVTLDYAEPVAEFSAWAATQDRQAILDATRQLFPDAKRFLDLTAEQLAAIRAFVEEPEVDAEEEAEALEALQGAQDAPGGEAEAEAEPAAAAPDDEPPGPFKAPELCGAVSPLSGATCTLDAGHKSATHRAGLKEAW